MEFWLRVYWAVDRGALQETKRQSMMRDLRKWMGDQAAKLTEQPDLLPYFALPYVSDLKKHPTFRHLFTEEWRDQLMDRLESFLEKLPTEETCPTLCTLYRAQCGRSDEEAPQHKSLSNEEQPDHHTSTCLTASAEQLKSGSCSEDQKAIDIPEVHQNRYIHNHDVVGILFSVFLHRMGLRDFYHQHAGCVMHQEGELKDVPESLGCSDVMMIEDNIDWNNHNPEVLSASPSGKDDIAAIQESLKVDDRSIGSADVQQHSCRRTKTIVSVNCFVSCAIKSQRRKDQR